MLIKTACIPSKVIHVIVEKESVLSCKLLIIIGLLLFLFQY